MPLAPVQSCAWFRLVRSGFHQLYRFKACIHRKNHWQKYLQVPFQERLIYSQINHVISVVFLAVKNAQTLINLEDCKKNNNEDGR